MYQLPNWQPEEYDTRIFDRAAHVVHANMIDSARLQL
jgi:hypothetical protein